MQAFDIHESIVNDYTAYLRSFITIQDSRILEKVNRAFEDRVFLPEGMVQFNPAYAKGPTLTELSNEPNISAGLGDIFGNYHLHHHQVEALRMGARGDSFVVTSGTGSGKSLTYLATIFNNILKSSGQQQGLQAIVVYPMNALINSQEEEIKKYEVQWLRKQAGSAADAIPKYPILDDELAALRQVTPHKFPFRYGKYTGQESQSTRDAHAKNPPHILLTNYMMLELIMTRHGEQWLRDAMRDGLRYLVFDELHTYRGRQGADVSMLVRRIKAHCGRPLVCIGTSATMTTGGNAAERKLVVAQVASQLFSQAFTSGQVVEERLALTTITENDRLPSAFDLQEAMARGRDLHGDADALLRNPLSVWLERRVAMRRCDDGNLERGKPLSLKEIAILLAQESGEAFETCLDALKALLQWAEHLNTAHSKAGDRRSFLPFKIHQFISQLGQVLVTMEPRHKRIISLDAGRYVRSTEGELPIYPVLFSRGSGHDFICVRKRDGKLLPRNPDDLPDRITLADLRADKKNHRPKRTLSEDDFPDGYVLFDNDDSPVWDEADMEMLPDNWFVLRKGKEELQELYRFHLPRRIWVDKLGNFSHEPGLAHGAWFVPARLLLDPTSGEVFDHRKRELTKLMGLGSEGRSTATTILSFAVIKALHMRHVPPRSQKLLSFTDNRQDASLQAGHFNDFLMLARLRSALYHALKEADGNMLQIDLLPTRVLRRLGLQESEYAMEASDQGKWSDDRTKEALKDYLGLRLLYDLRRGWRYNTPNLEQCALLQIRYEGLEQLCKMPEHFANLPLLNQYSPEERIQCLTQILDFFRTTYAFQYHKLEGSEMEDMVDRIRGKLDSNKLWSLDKEERIEQPVIMVPRSVGEVKSRIATKSIGTRSNVAKFLRKRMKDSGLPQLRGDEMTTMIERICELLALPKLLKTIPIHGERGEGKGYRLMIDKVEWHLGDGQSVRKDEIRTIGPKAVAAKPNAYFRKLYQQDFSEYQRPLVGREHTGQLTHQDRSKREEGFRAGDIAALFCSPTMELGIDIHELNVVHLRNVPPNPANYAQRSGRAGRSGQAALVFTYCSGWSPHDRHYFQHSDRMVSGQVAPPKIDLSNEELIRSHFHAFILMELGLGSLNMSATDILDMGQLPELPLKEEIRLHIEQQLLHFGRQWMDRFAVMIQQIPALAQASWFGATWLEGQLREFLPRLDASFRRWRTMYLHANAMVEEAHNVLQDTSIKKDNPKKQEAKRNYGAGMRRREILTNEESQTYGGNSEFYVYRYLAAEGFLPGYGFTRLPVRAFLGNRRDDKSEFVSRPRFIAIREFGPRNIVYHNGGKYVMHRMALGRGEANVATMTVSKETGYAYLSESGRTANNDPITGNPLQGEDKVEYFNDLLPLDECDAKPQERISCEEEERQREGYVTDTYFAFSNGIDGTRQVEVTEHGNPLLRVIYDQAAQLIQVNSRWKGSKEQGFLMGEKSGRWKFKKDENKQETEDKQDTEDKPKRVRLYTTDTSDILYLLPSSELGLDLAGVTTLAYAIKRAIERRYQIEERELSGWIMGTTEPHNILIHEAAEGSLGILAQLVSDTRELQAVLLEACAVVSYAPETGEDLNHEQPKATYNDLLSYYNQRAHELLDRHSAGPALSRLSQAQFSPIQGRRTQEEQYAHLMECYDLASATERQFIEFLYQGGYALPDLAQYNPPECYCSADFAYKTAAGLTLIFCDGTVHDDPKVKADDQRKRACAADHYDIIEWHHSEALPALVNRRKDIFRKIR